MDVILVKTVKHVVVESSYECTEVFCSLPHFLWLLSTFSHGVYYINSPRHCGIEHH